MSYAIKSPPPDHQAEQSDAAAGAGQPRFCFLGRERAAEVSLLEQRCYPAPWSPQLVLSEFDKDISLRLGLLLDNVVVAYSFSYLIIDDLHLLNIAVAPEFRGQGYGKYLLCRLLQYAVECAVSCASLEVRPSNITARSLYHKLGFVQVGTRRNYYRDNGEDAFLLERALAPEDHDLFGAAASLALGK